jgi:hypothetical protein
VRRIFAQLWAVFDEFAFDAWCFCGEVVVERVVNVAIGRTYFATEITPTFLNFVFGGWRGVFGAGAGAPGLFPA